MRIEIPSALLLLILLQTGPAYGQSNDLPHPSWNVAACTECHASEETVQLASRVTRPCRALCATCHEFSEVHHPVGKAITRVMPAPLLLTGSGTNTCVTCHDTTRPRFESTAWVSQSLIERARRPKENRTSFLVLRNDRGQLCRNCH